LATPSLRSAIISNRVRWRWKGFETPLRRRALIEVVLRAYEGTVRIVRRDQAETDDLGRQV
jgi:hypothetical protein